MKTNKLFRCIALAGIAFASCKKGDNKVTPSNNNNNNSQTDTLSVSGDVSGTWKKGSLVYVTGDVFVPEGQSLTIEEGVKIIIDPSDASATPEFIIKGNFYCIGSATAPISFSVPDNKKTTWGAKWGGLLAGPTCREFLLSYVDLSQGGAVTTEASASYKAQFYKAEAGERVPAVWYGGSGKVVIQNSVIHNFNEDGCYIEGGNVIVSNNKFYTTGIENGDAINIKSGVLADVAFNLVYSPNTNAMKLSNSGDRNPQAYVFGYNNTIVNCGWRRPTTKGGSIWVEKKVRVELYNNLLINDRYGVKRDKGNKEDERSVIMKTYYFGYNQTCVDQFQPNDEVIAGTGDIISKTVGANDPMLENYSLSTNLENADFNTSWDFHLKPGSPALQGGKTNFTSHFTAAGVTINGIKYVSPAPANHFGAFGTK